MIKNNEKIDKKLIFFVKIGEKIMNFKKIKQIFKKLFQGNFFENIIN